MSYWISWNISCLLTGGSSLVCSSMPGHKILWAWAASVLNSILQTTWQIFRDPIAAQWHHHCMTFCIQFYFFSSSKQYLYHSYTTHHYVVVPSPGSTHHHCPRPPSSAVVAEHAQQQVPTWTSLLVDSWTLAFSPPTLIWICKILSGAWYCPHWKSHVQVNATLLMPSLLASPGHQQH